MSCILRFEAILCIEFVFDIFADRYQKQAHTNEKTQNTAAIDQNKKPRAKLKTPSNQISERCFSIERHSEIYRFYAAFLKNNNELYYKLTILERTNWTNHFHGNWKNNKSSEFISIMLKLESKFWWRGYKLDLSNFQSAQLHGCIWYSCIILWKSGNRLFRTFISLKY